MTTDTLSTQTTPGIRERICKSCGIGFSYPIGPGRDRLHCSDECRESWKKKNQKPRDQWPRCECGTIVRQISAKTCNKCYTSALKKRAGKCLVHKCREPATRKGPGLCEKHYYRKRRTGTTDDREVIGWYKDGHGYVHSRNKSHPLAKKSGYVAEHRMVLFNAIGEGEHPCYWCGIKVGWEVMHVDHVDEDKTNNELGNLVPSCASCNKARGAMLHLLRRIKPEVREEVMMSITKAINER